MNNHIKYPDANRVDFLDYLNSYADLQRAFGRSVNSARAHWLDCGRFEGRNIKIKYVDYNLVETYIKENFTNFNNTSQKVNLITSLYDEPDPVRRQEYIYALKLNIQNPLIEKIYIFYEPSLADPDGGTKTYHDDVELTTIMEHQKVEVIHFYERPSFDDLINYSNTKPQGIWMISNADIIHTPDIEKIFKINLHNKLLALTRWDFVSETEITPYHAFDRVNTISQDTWIYKTPLQYPDSLVKYKLGELACDCFISRDFKQHDIHVYNPCMDIKTLHLHFQNSRTQDYSETSQKILETQFNNVWPTVSVCDINDI